MDGMEATALMWELLEGGHLDPEFDGLKVLALWGADDAGLYTRDKPIRGLDDIEGMLLCARRPRAQANQIRVHGATPVAMAITRALPAARARASSMARWFRSRPSSTSRCMKWPNLLHQSPARSSAGRSSSW